MPFLGAQASSLPLITGWDVEREILPPLEKFSSESIKYVIMFMFPDLVQSHSWITSDLQV